MLIHSKFSILHRTVSKEHVENCLAGLTLYHLDIANSMTNRIYSIFCAYLYSISTIGTSVIELVFCELYLSLFETFPNYKKLQKLVLWSRKFLFQILSRLKYSVDSSWKKWQIEKYQVKQDGLIWPSIFKTRLMSIFPSIIYSYTVK